MEDKKKSGKSDAAYRHLTTAQKAEAAALWRSGTMTLDALSKHFKKRPETMSRLFKSMGIEKGSGVEAAVKKMAEAVEAHVVSDIEETLARIKETKNAHYKYAKGLSQVAWSELVRARNTGLDIGSLKDTLMSIKLIGEIQANSRKEIYTVLDVEKVMADQGLDTLPELVVRELSQDEVVQLRGQVGEELILDSDPGLDMLGDSELDEK